MKGTYPRPCRGSQKAASADEHRLCKSRTLHINAITKWLTDPDADNYPFPHKIGERLRSQSKNLEGIVRNAKYAGTEEGESAWITYYIETDTGEIIQLPSAELEKVGQPIQQPLFGRR